MSADLELPGCPVPIRPVPRAFVEAARRLGDRFAVLDLYRAQCLDPERPPPLAGKDARNPFRVAQHAEALRELDAEYHALREYLHRHPQARWIIDG